MLITWCVYVYNKYSKKSARIYKKKKKKKKQLCCTRHAAPNQNRQTLNIFILNIKMKCEKSHILLAAVHSGCGKTHIIISVAQPASQRVRNIADSAQCTRARAHQIKCMRLYSKCARLLLLPLVCVYILYTHIHTQHTRSYYAKAS